MSALEVLGTIALAVFLAPYTAALIGWIITGIVWLALALYDGGRAALRAADPGRCHCPGRCPKHGRK